jgi:hypothetical protein
MCWLHLQCVVRHVLITFMPTVLCSAKVVLLVTHTKAMCWMYLTVCCQACTYNIHARSFMLCKFVLLVTHTKAMCWMYVQHSCSQVWAPQKFCYLLHIPRQCVGCTYSVLLGMYLQHSWPQFCALQKLHYLLHIPKQCVGCTYNVLSGMYITTFMSTVLCFAKVALLATHTKAMCWMYLWFVVVHLFVTSMPNF